MNPAERGWLKHYIAQKNNLPIHLGKRAKMDKDKFLYHLLQPTGLIYGHPIHAPAFEHSKENRWNYFNKMKIVVVDSFIQSAFINYKNRKREDIEWENFYPVAVKGIDTYFKKIEFTKKRKSFFSLFNAKKDSIEQAEETLQSILLLKSGSNFFWTNLFQKSLLFLDTYYFGEWFGNNLKSVKWHKDSMKLLLLDVIVAAINSRHIKQTADKKLMRSFLKGSQLSKDQLKEARGKFKSGTTIEAIDFRMADTWLLKKYVLELLVLLIWTDKVIDEREKLFLNNLGDALGLSELEVDLSLIAIESFVLDNWKDVYFLQSKHSFQLISEKLINRYTKVIEVDIENIIRNIRGSSTALNLVSIFEDGKITDDDRLKLRLLLIDQLKQVNNLSTISLPFNFLTVHNLLKIIKWNNYKQISDPGQINSRG